MLSYDSTLEIRQYTTSQNCQAGTNDRRIHLPSIRELQPLVSQPMEELGVEHKGWIDLTSKEHKATLAKAAIALANHGGGFIVIGMADQSDRLQSQPPPSGLLHLTQDDVNSAISRHADPAFHCQMHLVEHPCTNIKHPVIVVPGDLTVPVMAKRNVEGIIAQHRCYIRKPGPRSEEPQTGEEWRSFLHRCLQSQRADMLESIRTIVLGQAESHRPDSDTQSQLQSFRHDSRERWKDLTEDLPERAAARFPHGWYEMVFWLVGVRSAPSLSEVYDRLSEARKIKLSGWTPFVDLDVPGWKSYANDDSVEAWPGRPRSDEPMERDPWVCDYWRASIDGKLYTICGYLEDGTSQLEPGTLLDVSSPISRVGEALLFANRFGESFEDVEHIEISCQFSGLAGRRLGSLTGYRGVFDERTSNSDAITLSSQATPQQIRDNIVEILHPLLLGLYELFGFYSLPLSVVQRAVDELLRRRY